MCLTAPRGCTLLKGETSYEYVFVQAHHPLRRTGAVPVRYQDALGTYLVKLSGMNLSVSDNRILNTLLYTVADIERTADHCSNEAVEMLQVSEGKLETHEYLNALKSGELHESAAYVERFAKYKAKYTFPEEA